MAYTMTVENHVATFTIAHIEKKNAISSKVVEGLESFLTKIEKSDEVEYVVITGTGDTFCSGGDVSEYRTLWTKEDAYPMLSRMTSVLYRLATLPVPTIALLNGTAVGGGCEIATACDYRLMHVDAKAGFIQGTIALTTGWGGATLLFEKFESHAQVLRLLSEASILKAPVLHEWTWVTELYKGEGNDALAAFLERMQQIPASVHRSYKEIAIRKWNASSLAERMLLEAKQCSVLWEADEHHDAVAKFLNKRTSKK